MEAEVALNIQLLMFYVINMITAIVKRLEHVFIPAACQWYIDRIQGWTKTHFQETDIKEKKRIWRMVS